MKKHLAQISLFFVTIGLYSCFQAPDFSDTPVLEFNTLKYINYPDNAVDARDSLILRFDFKDGDGDFGLNDDYTFYPFHPFDIVLDSRDSLVTFEDEAVPPFYAIDPSATGARRKLEVSTKPAYNECDYSIFEINSEQDTVWILENEYNTNFHIDFFRKRSGEYEQINFGQIFGGDRCEFLSYDSRIPIFNEEDQGNSMSGTINYYLKGFGWEFALSTDTFKVEFYVYDRELNKSNVVVSPDLTLLGIMENRN